MHPSSVRLPSQPGSARIRTLLVVGGVCFMLAALAADAARIAAQPQAAPPKPHTNITFARDIAPIFQKNCIACHGSEKPQGGLRLDSEAATLKGGESGKVIIPGDSEKSPLVKRLLGVGEEARMPMGADPLPASQIKLIRAWIDQNSFVIPKEPAAAPAALIAPVAAHPQAERVRNFRLADPPDSRRALLPMSWARPSAKRPATGFAGGNSEGQREWQRGDSR